MANTLSTLIPRKRSRSVNSMETSALGQATVLGHAMADVAAARERSRQQRLRRIFVVLAVVGISLGLGPLDGHAVSVGWPHLPPVLADYLPGILLVVMLGSVIVVPMLGAGRSPHVVYRAAEIDVSLADVKGAGVVVDEVVKTLNLFLAFKTFRERMGGTARRAILFEGPPGTGKTYMAKAMAKEAGVPFLFVSSSAFQSMFYGQTNRKIRAYFKALRKMARKEGGAIGFIEEIDAIGAARRGLGSSSGREGSTGVVNDLLIQLQSFDVPPTGRRMAAALVDVVNRWLPHDRQL